MPGPLRFLLPAPSGLLGLLFLTAPLRGQQAELFDTTRVQDPGAAREDPQRVFPFEAFRGNRPASVVFAKEGVLITEYMDSGEWVELTNTSDSVVDLSGWSLDDRSARPGAFNS